jgi:tetratricopeptide (TPR) repeat protein
MNIASRILLLAACPLAAAPEFPFRASAVPGGVALVPLGDGASAPEVRYRGERVLVRRGAEEWVAVVGIKLSAKPGPDQVEVAGRPLVFTIHPKKYPEQRLTGLNPHHVNPDKEDEALSKVPAAFTWGANSAVSVLGVAKAYLAGEIAFRQDKAEEAIARLQEAVRLEDGLKYDEPPACTVPARHALGAVLLAAKRAAEAEAVYRADLKAYPANYWSLLGLARALEAQGKKAEAKAAQARFDRAAQRSDIRAQTSCLCVGEP